MKAAKKATKRVTKKDYDKLTPKQKRLLVAKDVLKQLEARKYKPAGGEGGGGFYLGADESGSSFADDDGAGVYEQDGQTFFKKNSCYVCAVGAAVVSQARVFDKCTVGDVVFHQESMLADLFADSGGTYGNMRNDMESAYEDGPEGPDVKIAKLKSRRNRLKAIYENVVRNKGDFIPVDD